ncbi:MAG: MFS transporter, partial [Solirubrobacterales bacterium]
AGIVALMPFVDSVWQIYPMIFLLNACAAVFTPAFQALIPVVLPDEERYTRALSYSRVAYELENLASPALAALALGFLSYDALFAGDGVTFLVSGALVVSATLPRAVKPAAASRIWSNMTRGIRRYFAVPELRGLFALNFAVAAAGAVILVNTVLYVRDELARGQGDVAWALGAAGAGSLVFAFATPVLLRRFAERKLMLRGAAVLPAGLAFAALSANWWALLAIWFVLGVGVAAVQTPAGRLVQRAVRGDDGPELFAAQFALSHACWLVTYPLAGVVGSFAGLSAAAVALAVLAAAAVAIASRLWVTGEPRTDA